MNTMIGTKSPPPASTTRNDVSVGENHLHRIITKTQPAHSMIAGYVAGFSGTLVGFPLDSLKVWLQTNTYGKNKFLDATSKSSSSSAATGSKKGQNDLVRNSSIYANHGKNNTNHHVVSSSSKVYGANRNSSTSTTISGTISSKNTYKKPISTLFRTFRALYSGVSGPLITVGIVQSINFAMYDATRQFLYRRQQQQYDPRHSNQRCNTTSTTTTNREYLTRDSLVGVGISGSIAGMVTAILTAPLIMIKINQQINGNSFRVAFKETFVVERHQHQGRVLGLRPFGAGFLPHFFQESIGRAIYVTTYEGLKRYLLATKESSKHNSNLNYMMNDGMIISLSLQERMSCAAVSGILCWATFYPLDTLRSRLYHEAASNKQQQQRQQKSSMTNTIVKTIRIMQKERSFYRGFSVSLLRAGPVAAAVLPIYDLTLERLSSSTSSY
mmetsp:Transcript_39077/g.43962  ORF Transcript_39077/g.43962 Transcript_39077/m.43962 type:complete len:441 (-) Transcript_39077:236-1558(-)